MQNSSPTFRTATARFRSSGLRVGKPGKCRCIPMLLLPWGLTPERRPAPVIAESYPHRTAVQFSKYWPSQSFTATFEEGKRKLIFLCSTF